jgi:hypothetical protein
MAEVKLGSGTIYIPESIIESTFKLQNLIDFSHREIANPFKFELPDDLLLWWSKVEKAKLFLDIDHAQWGLQIFSAENSFIKTNEYLIDRIEDARANDVIIGSFYGDSELLLLSCNFDDYGCTYIVDSYYGRNDWDKASSSFYEFISYYISQEGEKYWQ